MPSKTLYMETTTVEAGRTAGEVSALLVSAGARQIATEYDGQARVTGLRFVLLVGEVPVSFALPVRSDPVYSILLKRRKGSLPEAAKQQIRAQAERVAWRQLLRWVQAQLALIETGVVAAHEVFLPYLIHAGTDQTLFEFFQGNGLKHLTAGGAR